MKSVHTHTYTLPVSWKKANEAHWNFLRFWLVSHNCSTASNPNSCASYGPSCSTVQLHCRIRLLQMWKWGKTSLKLVQNPIWMMPLIKNINGKQQSESIRNCDRSSWTASAHMLEHNGYLFHPFLFQHRPSQGQKCRLGKRWEQT